MKALCITAIIALLSGCASWAEYVKQAEAADRNSRERECRDSVMWVATGGNQLYTREVSCPGREPVRWFYIHTR